ncbi:hypothetical protein Tco_1135621 [Tanacetum coccineum]
MENANPPPTRPILPAMLRARFNQELQELQKISAFIDSRLERTLRRERIINSFDGDDLAFEYMIGFRKFTAYLDPILSMNIISRKAYNTIVVDRLEGAGKNLISIVRDVYVFVGSFTYVTENTEEEEIDIMTPIEVIFDEKKLGSS